MKKRLLSLFTAAAMFAAFSVQVMVGAEDFELPSSKMLSPGDLAPHTGVSFEGRTAEEFNTEGKTAAVRYDNIGLTPSFAGSTEYLLVDCYYKKSASTTTPYGLKAIFRDVLKKGSQSWDLYNDSSLKEKSSGLAALPNEWVTVAIDCRAQMEKLSSESWTLKGLQIEIPATTGDDRFYISNVRFSEQTGDFALNRSKILTASDLPVYTTETFKGKSDVMKFDNTSTATTKGIRYGNIHMGYPYAASNKYLLVDCYLDDTYTTTYNLGVTFRSVNNGGTWINSEPENTQTANNIEANKWVTAVIDCTIPLESLANKAQSLTQLQLNIPSTTGSLYIGNVRFAADEPGIQYVYEDENGNQYTYLSETGYVTINDETVPAYTNTADAFTGLGKAGGTVYLQGSLNSFTDVNPGTRGAVILRGLGDDEEDISENIIKGVDFEVKGGDITFDYLTIDPDTKGETSAKYSSFFTERLDIAGMKITIGANVKSSGLGIGNTKGGNTNHWSNFDKVIIDGGEFYSVTSTNNYTIGQVTRLGSVDYTINGGQINALYAGSNNSWEWENSVVRGDVRYTINGGDFTNYMVMGSAYGSTEIQGNVIWTINGGNMTDRRIIGGDGAATQGKRDQKYLNNVAAIVNLKGGQEGLSTLTLGTDDAKGLDINGSEIYILNNYEDNLGTKIADGSLAEYKLHVYNGKAEPVFANDRTTKVNGADHYFGGALVGFRLIPDENDASPRVNGVEVEPDEYGVYQIDADASNIIEVRFGDEPETTESPEPYIAYSCKINSTEASANMQLINTYDTDKTIVVALAQYDEHGKVIDIKAESITVSHNTESPTAYEIKADQVLETMKDFKVFVWDSFENMMPIKQFVYKNE